MFPSSGFSNADMSDPPLSLPTTSGASGIADSMFLNAANFDEDLKALLYSNERQNPTTAYFPNQSTAAVYQNNNNNNNKGGSSPSNGFEISPQQPGGTYGGHQEIRPGI